MDWKEILRNKAGNLRSLLYKYEDQLSPEERNKIKILIDNTFEITKNGRLDDLDYDVRDEGIRRYHAELDSKMKLFERFNDSKDSQR